MVLLGVRCAQITPLTGGKKDTEPPKLVKAIPENASLNANPKTIELTFDEYITLRDVANQFVITPQTKFQPQIEASGKKVKVKFSEAFLPNTTYKLSFGNAIVDLRESNNLPNFEYVFSTGPSIDSLALRGAIENATDKKAAPQVLVGLYPVDAQDSVIYKDKPLYLIRTDDQGRFAFNYLPDKPFKLVAIKDQNKNLFYDGSNEQIAFVEGKVDPKDSTEIRMRLFKEVPFKNFIKRYFLVEPGKVNIAFNKPQVGTTVSADGMIRSQWNSSGDTLSIYYANRFDTLTTYLSYARDKADTLYIKIPGQAAKPTERGAVKKNNAYLISSNVDNASVPFFATPVVSLNYPVYEAQIQKAGFVLLEKRDTARVVQKPYTLVADAEPALSFTLQTELSPESSYTLTIADSTFRDAYKRVNDSTGYKFRTSSPDDYAGLSMKLLFPQKENYIVILKNDKGQLVDRRVVELSLASTAEHVLVYKNLSPGNYYIEAVEDRNKNGTFDTGNYFLKTQPEVIYINSAAIKLLAGWEIENEWRVQ